MILCFCRPARPCVDSRYLGGLNGYIFLIFLHRFLCVRNGMHALTSNNLLLRNVSTVDIVGFAGGILRMPTPRQT